MLSSFIDEGSRVQSLLAAAAGSGPASSHPADVFAAELLLKFTPGQLLRGDRCDDILFRVRRPHTPLGAAVRAVLDPMAAGLTHREIGNRLGMTESPVRWYLQQVYDMVVTRRRQATLFGARQTGLISN